MALFTGSSTLPIAGNFDTNEKIALCLDILLELAGITEIVDQHDDRRLDELERDGLM